MYGTYLVLMIPENVRRWLGAELDYTSQVDCAPFIHVQVGTTQYACRWHC